MSTDCLVDFFFIWLAAQLYYFESKNILYGNIF